MLITIVLQVLKSIRRTTYVYATHTLFHELFRLDLDANITSGLDSDKVQDIMDTVSIYCGIQPTIVRFIIGLCHKKALVEAISAARARRYQSFEIVY